MIVEVGALLLEASFYQELRNRQLRRLEEVQRLVGALKTKLGGTYDDLVNRKTSFYGFDPDAPVKRHDNWRGTEQAKKYISELLNKNGIY